MSPMRNVKYGEVIVMETGSVNRLILGHIGYIILLGVFVIPSYFVKKGYLPGSHHIPEKPFFML